MSTNLPHGTSGSMSTSSALLKNSHNHLKNTTAQSSSTTATGNTLHNTAHQSSLNASTSNTLNVSNSNNEVDDFSYPFCDDVNKYEKINKIGQGLDLFS